MPGFFSLVKLVPNGGTTDTYEPNYAFLVKVHGVVNQTTGATLVLGDRKSVV